MKRYIVAESTNNPRYVCFDMVDGEEVVALTNEEKEAYRFEDVLEAIVAMTRASKDTKTDWKTIEIEEWEA